MAYPERRYDNPDHQSAEILTNGRLVDGLSKTEIAFWGGQIDVLIPDENSVIIPPVDAAEHWLHSNGNRALKMDIALIRHDKHRLFDGIENTTIEDAIWTQLKPDSEQLVELLEEESPHTHRLNMALTNLQGVALEMSRHDPNRDATDGYLRGTYLTNLDQISDILAQTVLERFSRYVGTPVKVPFRGAALTAQPFIQRGFGMLPLKFTRIALEDGKFAVGINAPRHNFKDAALDDIQLGKNDRAMLLEACITTGLTNISDFAHRIARDAKPAEMLVVAPVASRRGILNMMHAADLLEINLKIVTAKVYPGIGHAWSSGEDSIKDEQWNSVIGDPPKIVGNAILLDRLIDAEINFANRNGIQYP